MTTPGVDAFRRAYSRALRAYLRTPNESALRPAYELGREAVRSELGILDLTLVHHEALASTLKGAVPEEMEQFTVSAADFLLDSLSAFEMIRRGYTEAREVVALERRQATMLRRLSNLLADDSLTFGASGSGTEMLRLVAEHARELTRASCCVASLVVTSAAGEIRASIYDDSDDAAAAFTESHELSALARVLAAASGVVRITREQFSLDAGSRRSSDGKGWLGAPLTTLDGRGIGWIQLLTEANADFTHADEQVLAQVAEMTSAAAERMRLYHREKHG
jgi:hypothetical protein